MFVALTGFVLWPYRPEFQRDWSSRSINKTYLALAIPLLWALRLGSCSVQMPFSVSCQFCWTLSTTSTGFPAVMICLPVGTSWSLGSGPPTHPMLSAQDSGPRSLYPPDTLLWTPHKPQPSTSCGATTKQQSCHGGRIPSLAPSRLHLCPRITGPCLSSLGKSS